MNRHETILKPITLRRAEKLLVYFVLATVAGRYLEVVWQFFRYHISNPAYTLDQLALPPLAEPYGFGAVVVVALVVSPAKKYNLGIARVYLLNVIAMGFVEYVCAVALVLVFGCNNFWDYSNMPFNVQGYICLETSLLFGLAATLFMYYVYPVCERQLARLTRRQLGLTALVLGVLYLMSFVLFKRW